MKKIKKGSKPTRKESQNRNMSVRPAPPKPPKLPPGIYCCACGLGIILQESYLDTRNNKYYCKEHVPDYLLSKEEFNERYSRDKMLGPEINSTLNPNPTLKSTPMSSTKIPLNGFEQIPYNSIVAICKIIKEGEKAHGKGNWMKAADNYEDLIERLVHIINHTMLFIEGDRSEDHLAKVAWGGIFMREAARQSNELGDFK